jgi:DNA-binding beta-propeller fold protein YncE
MPRIIFSSSLAVAALLIVAGSIRGRTESAESTSGATKPGVPEAIGNVDRSPVDLVLTPDERFLITANQTSSTLSLVEVATGRVVDELRCGEHPTALALAPGGKRVLVSCAYAGKVEGFDVQPRGLKRVASVGVGFHPYGIAVSRNGRRAWVAQTDAATVVELDLSNLANWKVVRSIDVGRWPRQVALSPDGKTLAVATSGDQNVSMVDTAAGKMLFQHRTGGGLNIGQLQMDRAGKFVYFPWIIYRQFPITTGNIRLGWVLASRIARAAVSEDKYREAISLDVPGLAVGDPHGLALTPDESWMVCTAAGTHELLAYRMDAQNFMSVGGPGDLADPNVWKNDRKFFRVPLGGRPMNVRAARDGRRIFVANYLANAVQTVDLEKREVVQTIPLGSAATPSLARQGEAVFRDARKSLDQWYSCASCHYDGGINAVPMDTRNDGSDKTFKTVTALFHATQTAPWTWHGWQKDFEAAMRKSTVDTMLGPPPTDDDVKALVAYLDTLAPPPNPYLAAAKADATLQAAIDRGRAVFNGAKAGCANCHSGPHFTDGKIHDVGLGSEKDRYDGFNTPSLTAVFRRVRLLHDGRARSLEDVLTGDHNPAKVTGNGELTPDELRDLIAYLKTL